MTPYDSVDKFDFRWLILRDDLNVGKFICSFFDEKDEEKTPII